MNPCAPYFGTPEKPPVHPFSGVKCPLCTISKTSSGRFREGFGNQKKPPPVATPVHRGHVRCTGGAPQNGAQGAPKNPVHRGRFTRDLIAGRPLCTVLTRPLCTVFGAPPVHRILGAPCAPFKDAPCAQFLGAPCAPDFPRIRPLCTDFSLRRPLCTGFLSKRHPVHRIQSSRGSVT